MIAKKDYYLDEEGNVTTNVNKAARRIARKGHSVSTQIERQYGFVDGEAGKSEKTAPKLAATPAPKATAKADGKDAAS